jgi:hypothetical protein
VVHGAEWVFVQPHAGSGARRCVDAYPEPASYWRAQCDCGLLKHAARLGFRVKDPSQIAKFAVEMVRRAFPIPLSQL